MKIFKYLYLVTFITASFMSCKKVSNDDLSFVTNAAAPQNISAMFNITQDNSGMVTITPNGEGATSYDVFFGDATTTPGTVAPGKAVQHKYAEGVYTVKVVGHNISGKTAEASQPLTVSYRAPENLAVTAVIDPANSFKLNVSAKADYATFFQVYFGDVPNEVPQSFLAGQTISHVYTTVGDFNIKVVALSGGAATTVFTKKITIIDPVVLPITFESPTVNYAWSNFAGGVVTVIDNPQKNGINTSAKVGKMVKYNGEVYGGSLINLAKPIDFSTNKVFRMKVFSPRVGAKVLLKVENATNGAISYEKGAVTTVANAWEDLVFDYSTIDNRSYQHIVLIFELGTKGDGSDNFTFLFDDIRLTNTGVVTSTFPIDFEAAPASYKFTDFNGGHVTVIANPNKGGINSSNQVGKMIKGPGGEVYGGSFLTLPTPIDFSTAKTFTMKVFAPKVGTKVLLKAENLTDGSISYEQTAVTTTANTWELLTFNFSAINTSKSYQKLTLIFDLGTVGDGSANFTYLFDDINLN